MNKKVLKPELDFTFNLIGIISSLKDYRLAHFINKSLVLSLERNSRYPEYKGTSLGPDGYFAFFSCFVEESETEFYFFSNKGSNGPIIPELRDIDHFMMIIPKDKLLEKEILHGLSVMERVEKALVLDVMRLRSRENLLFF